MGLSADGRSLGGRSLVRALAKQRLRRKGVLQVGDCFLVPIATCIGYYGRNSRSDDVLWLENLCNVASEQATKGTG